MNEKNADEKEKGCCAAEDATTTCCQPSAGSGSSCCTSGEASWKKGKVLVSVIIMVAAIGVGAHSFVKATSAKSQKNS